MNRPITTLFMLMSVDGKISTGDRDELDVDQDFPLIDGLKEGEVRELSIHEVKTLLVDATVEKDFLIKLISNNKASFSLLVTT